MPLGNLEFQQEILNSQWKFRVPIGNLEFLLENYNSVRKLRITAGNFALLQKNSQKIFMKILYNNLPLVVVSYGGHICIGEQHPAAGSSYKCCKIIVCNRISCNSKEFLYLTVVLSCFGLLKIEFLSFLGKIKA